VPELLINLFIINKDLMNGFMIGNKGVLIKLTKGETTLVFNPRLNTKGGFMSGIKMVLDLNQVANTSSETHNMMKTMSVEIKNLRKILGHYGETHLIKTMNAYEIKVFGKLEACESYAISKSKQKKTNKV
jgi:hypothetical protein